MLRSLATGFLVLFVSTSTACGGATNDDTADDAPAKTVTQAPLVGTVTLREGDCMPVTTPERCRVGALGSARVEAYAAIHLPPESPSSTSNRFVIPPGTSPVQTAMTDANGRFSFVLPEGRYTVVTFYDGEWYPESYRSTDEEWAGVEVNAAWLEDLSLEINRASD